MASRTKIAIFDNDVFLSEELKVLDKKHPGHPIVVITKKAELKNVLSDNVEPLDLLVLKDKMTGVVLESLISSIKESNPELYILVVHADDAKSSCEKRLNGLGVDAIIPKPKNLSSYLAIAKKILKERYNWTGVIATDEEKDQELSIKPETLLAISIKDMLLTPKSFFNIYLKLGEEKFVKILNASDPITAEFIDKYLKKNLEDFYVRHDEHIKYIKLCNLYTDRLISGPGVIKEKQVNQLLHSGDNIATNLASVGINRENIQLARNFLESTYQFIRKSKTNDPVFNKMLELALNHDHSSVVILLATLLSKELGFESSKTVKIIGTAAMLHDIYLIKEGHDIPENQLEISTKSDELELFNNHAKHGADYLRSLKIFDEIVCQAIEQHHLRKGSKKKHNIKINLVSEIIGVCDEFANVVIAAEKPETEKVFFIENNLTQFSLKIQKAFETLLTCHDK